MVGVKLSWEKFAKGNKGPIKKKDSLEIRKGINLAASYEINSSVSFRMWKSVKLS